MDVDGIPIGDFYPLAQAAEKLPGRVPGRSLSARTIHRYRSQGVLRGTARVRLRAVRLGGGDWYVCDEWVQDFLKAVSAPIGQQGAA